MWLWLQGSNIPLPERGSATRSSVAKQEAFGTSIDVVMCGHAAAHRAALRERRATKSGGASLQYGQVRRRDLRAESTDTSTFFRITAPSPRRADGDCEEVTFRFRSAGLRSATASPSTK